MDPHKMTPEQLAAYIKQQTQVHKIELSGNRLATFVHNLHKLQAEAAEEYLEHTGYAEANKVIARIMAMK